MTYFLYYFAIGLIISIVTIWHHNRYTDYWITGQSVIHEVHRDIGGYQVVFYVVWFFWPLIVLATFLRLVKTGFAYFVDYFEDGLRLIVKVLLSPFTLLNIGAMKIIQIVTGEKK